jgi:hypothetical protein
MTDIPPGDTASTNSAPPPDAPVTAPAPPATPTPAKVKPRRGIWPVFFVPGFLILAAGEACLWHRLQTIPQAPPSTAAQLASLQAEVTSLQNTHALAAPAAATAAAPLPGAADTSIPAASAAPLPAAADAALADRLGTLNALVDALQTQFIADHNALNAMQTASATLPKLTSDVATIQTETAADHATLAQLQTSTAGLDKLTARITILSRLQTARMALDAGQPLGPIPNAPPALAVFASTPPPTASALVIGFPAAARAAQSASVAGATRGTYWSTVKARLENLVTVSAGGHVLIGAPAAAVLNQAQNLLNAGDLAGAVAAISTLSATTQDAMGSWLTQARSLVAARNAIAAMAASA